MYKLLKVKKPKHIKTLTDLTNQTNPPKMKKTKTHKTHCTFKTHLKNPTFKNPTNTKAITINKIRIFILLMGCTPDFTFINLFKPCKNFVKRMLSPKDFL